LRTTTVARRHPSSATAQTTFPIDPVRNTRTPRQSSAAVRVYRTSMQSLWPPAHIDDPDPSHLPNLPVGRLVTHLGGRKFNCGVQEAWADKVSAYQFATLLVTPAMSSRMASSWLSLLRRTASQRRYTLVETSRGYRR